MKTKLFIDFDGTLFNTAALSVDTFEQLQKVGFTKSELLSSYQAECLDYKFTVDGFLDRLIKVRKFNLSLTKARIRNLYELIPKKYLYEDAVAFLENVDRTKYELNLISMGDVSFQKLKIDYSGLIKRFDHIFVTDLQKWEYLKKLVSQDEKFILVDDRADTVHQVSKSFPHAFVFEINRKCEDKNDPARNGRQYKNLSISNLKKFNDYLEGGING